ncbi:MAG: transcriptional repressor LexA [Armatimonadetes bacterium]|nr:transcriptional repressor LexA [Armatimonadota bacterium]
MTRRLTLKMTPKQETILCFIRDYVQDHGFPPSIREIGDAVGIASLRGVTCHLDALQRKGYIARGSTPRCIKIVHPAYRPTTEATMLPLVGTIAAGEPILAEQNVEALLPVPPEMVRGVDDAFLLRVRGDSMSGDGILPRDLVVIRPQKATAPNDIVAVLVDEDATIKRIKVDKSEIVLIPSNDTYERTRVPRDKVQVIGKVIGLLRDYGGVAF